MTQRLAETRPCRHFCTSSHSPTFATAYTRGWAADSINTRIRLKAELDRAEQELALLREEMRIKDARMARLNPFRRPHYPPTERLAILELKAAQGWSERKRLAGSSSNQEPLPPG